MLAGKRHHDDTRSVLLAQLAASARESSNLGICCARRSGIWHGVGYVHHRVHTSHLSARFALILLCRTELDMDGTPCYNTRTSWLGAQTPVLLHPLISPPARNGRPTASHLLDVETQLANKGTPHSTLLPTPSQIDQSRQGTSRLMSRTRSRSCSIYLSYGEARTPRPLPPRLTLPLSSPGPQACYRLTDPKPAFPASPEPLRRGGRWSSLRTMTTPPPFFFFFFCFRGRCGSRPWPRGARACLLSSRD